MGIYYLRKRDGTKQRGREARKERATHPVWPSGKASLREAAYKFVHTTNISRHVDTLWVEGETEIPLAKKVVDRLANISEVGNALHCKGKREVGTKKR